MVFSVPNEGELKAAHGHIPEAPFKPSSLFKSIPFPSSTDWLSLYKERGQTFDDFIADEIYRSIPFV